LFYDTPVKKFPIPYSASFNPPQSSHGGTQELERMDKILAIFTGTQRHGSNTNRKAKMNLRKIK